MCYPYFYDGFCLNHLNAEIKPTTECSLSFEMLWNEHSEHHEVHEE